MKIYDCIQGTTEWLELRAGIPTASQADQIVTPTGKPSKSAERYLYTLLAERCLGRPITEHVTFYMRRGSEMEKEALAYYQFMRDVKTEVVGFITTDDGLIGASPDQLVEEDGLLEIKCPTAHQHMQWLCQDGGAYKEYKVQCQTQLLVSERSWVDVLSYYPGLPEALVRIERDEDFISLLGAGIYTFIHELERHTQILAERGLIADTARRAPLFSERDELIGALKDSLRSMKGNASE
jgi:putative phage-type endonuclease